MTRGIITGTKSSVEKKLFEFQRQDIISLSGKDIICFSGKEIICLSGKEIICLNGKEIICLSGKDIMSQWKRKYLTSGKYIIFVSGKEDAANNFARGHYTVGKEVIDMVGQLYYLFR